MNTRCNRNIRFRRWAPCAPVRSPGERSVGCPGAALAGSSSQQDSPLGQEDGHGRARDSCGTGQDPRPATGGRPQSLASGHRPVLSCRPGGGRDPGRPRRAGEAGGDARDTGRPRPGCRSSAHRADAHRGCGAGRSAGGGDPRGRPRHLRLHRGASGFRLPARPVPRSLWCVGHLGRVGDLSGSSGGTRSRRAVHGHDRGRARSRAPGSGHVPGGGGSGHGRNGTAAVAGLSGVAGGHRRDRPSRAGARTIARAPGQTASLRRPSGSDLPAVVVTAPERLGRLARPRHVGVRGTDGR